MKILDTRVYRGPNLYALRKVIRLRVDLGELEDYPTGRLPGFVDAPAGGDPDPARARLLLRRAGRLRAPHDRGRGDLAGARAGARRHRAPVPRRHAGQLRQDARATTCRAGSTTSSTATRRRWWAWRPPRWACASSCHLLPPERAAHLPGPLRLPGRARGSRPPRPAPRLRPLDRLPGARRRGAGHALDPPQRPLAGAARPRQVPAPHPGDRHQRDPPHRRRDRLGQAADQPDPLRPRAAGAPAGAGARAGGRRRGRRAARLSRSSSSRSTATTARGCRSTSPPRSRCEAAFEKAYEYSSVVIVETFQEGHDYRILVVDGKVVAAAAAGARPRGGRRRGTRSPSWSRSSTRTPGAASATRRC